MSSIVTAVLTGTLGLLVKKGRQKIAEKLKDSDATGQQFRSWIIEEFDNVNSKLDAMARSDLGASISFFKEGVVFLNKAMDFEASALLAQMGSDKEKKVESPQKEIELSSAGVNTASLDEELKKLDLTNLNESGKEALSDSKKRFDDARREATKAFNNKALTPSDRILAMAMRLMATILEKAENPANSLAACISGLEELHLTPFVRENFKVELTGGVKAKFQTDERRQIISSVCQVNRIIYDVFVIVGEKQMLFILPCVEIGSEKVDPLRDSRVAKTLRQLDVGDCSVAWSFGLEGGPSTIATNSLGQFLLVNIVNRCKVFDAKGTFLFSFGLPAEAEDSCRMARISAVATDRDDNIYAVVNGYEKRQERTTPVSYMYVFNKQTQFSHKFLVGHEFSAERLIVKDYHLLVVGRFKPNSEASEEMACDSELVDYITVYKRDGTHIGYVSEQTLAFIQDVTVVDDGRIMVLNNDSCVYVFADVTTDHGVDHLYNPHASRFLRKFLVVPKAHAIAFHWATGHVIIVSEISKTRSQVSLYSKDGNLERSIDIALEMKDSIGEAAVTADGSICVATDTKVLVL